MTKKIKIILAIFLIALAIGYTVLYHWAKNQFIGLYQESKQQLQSEGWVIEESPLTFSGFPFRLTANQEKLKLTKTVNNYETKIEASEPTKLHVSLLNPMQYKFEGKVHFARDRTDVRNGLFPTKGSFENGRLKLTHRNKKLEVESIVVQHVKLEVYDLQNEVEAGVQIQEAQYNSENYNVKETTDGQVLETSNEYILNDVEFMTAKDGTLSPLFHLKKLKATLRGKMPAGIAEQVKSIFNETSPSPIAQICQAGGKVPPLKDTLNLMEKVGSTGKLDVEVEHNNYVINLDLDAKILNGAPELLLTTQVNNLNSLFDAFNLDPTMRLIANGFVKKESNQSEKAHLIVKLSAGSLFVNDMEIMKVPMPDWDNIVLPADVCSKYATVAPTNTATPKVPVVLPVASPL